MSERVGAAGKEAGDYELEHKGKTYTITPVITDRVMLDFEIKLYNRACAGLYAQREHMPDDMYDKKLEALRLRFEAGDYAFESRQTMAFLNSQKGAIMLLATLMSCTESEVLTLFVERGPELKHILSTVITMSFPKIKEGDGGPKRKTRR